MKTITLIFAIFISVALTKGGAQNTWTQKANFGGGARNYAVGFFIGNKGYIGTGEVYPTFYNDFWEYNPSTNVWTQKASFGGTARTYAVGFSIGTKGYIGTGYDGAYKNDFWEYSSILNTWTQKANFMGTARAYAVGFSINNTGYIGTGYSINTGLVSDFWQYNPSANAWSIAAGIASRFKAVGFSIGGKGYFGTGSDGISYKNDFWEYNPAINTWVQKANFPGTPRINAVGFFIGSQGFITTGYDGISPYKKDLWQYDPATNTWTQKALFSGSARSEAVAFSIGGKGYIGTGFTGSSITSDFWEYTPDSTVCPVPINLSVTNITATSAKLNWSAVSGVQAYRIRYKVDGTNIWIKKTTNTNSKSITGLLPNTTYKWEVQTYCQLVPHVKSDWSPAQQFTTPLRMSNELQKQALFQIYPNPADDHATIQFSLLQASHICIKVYDGSGKDIITPLNDYLEQGNHTLQLNTNQFPKGVYLVKLITDYESENKKLIVQ